MLGSRHLRLVPNAFVAPRGDPSPVSSRAASWHSPCCSQTPRVGGAAQSGLRCPASPPRLLLGPTPQRASVPQSSSSPQFFYCGRKRTAQPTVSSVFTRTAQRRGTVTWACSRHHLIPRPPPSSQSDPLSPQTLGPRPRPPRAPPPASCLCEPGSPAAPQSRVVRLCPPASGSRRSARCRQVRPRRGAVSASSLSEAESPSASAQTTFGSATSSVDGHLSGSLLWAAANAVPWAWVGERRGSLGRVPRRGAAGYSWPRVPPV